MTDFVTTEAVKCLRDWHTIWKHQLYIHREVELFEKIGGYINDLIEWRRQLLEATLTKDQFKELTLKMTRVIDSGNRLLGLDLVPRIDGQIVDPEVISPIELYQIHHESSNGVSPSQRASNTSTHSSAITFVANFLYLDVRDISLPMVNFEDNFELSFYLFDYGSSLQLSEKFVLRISGTTGMTNGHNHGYNNDHSSKVNNQYSTVFTDLSNISTSGEVYLLIQAVRIGKMLSVEGKSSKSAFSSSSTLPSSLHSNSSATSTIGSWNNNVRFKRPFGSAILSLSDILKADTNEKEFTVKLLCSNSESDFYQVHDMLYKKQTNKLTQLANTSISLSVKFLTGPDPGKIMNENPLIFQNVTCTTGKMGFPDVIMPGDVRNDLYLTLESGEFEKGGKSIPKNVEANITLYGADASPIKGSISFGCGVDSVTTYTSQVLYHNNNPRWMESIKVLIPLEVCDLKAHIRIEFRHCSTKESHSQKEKDKNFLGFCFFPLSDEKGTIIKDGLHELYLYKSNGQSEIRNRLNDPSSYLSLPYGPKDDRDDISHEMTVAFLTRSNKESVHVRTQLCSTKLTQNTDLLTLLKWRSNPETVQDALMKVHRLNGEEVVKFLQDILDALFSMFSTHDGNQTHHSGLVFKVLLHILSLLDDPKYEHFKPVLDTYINGHFAAALVYKGLLYSVKQCTDLIKDLESQESIQMCFRSLEWIFKFIVQSRILYARATGDHCNEDIFKQDLFTLFSSFKRMLSFNYEPTLVGCQVAFIDNFTSTYNQLLRVLVPNELTSIIKMIIDCLPCLEPCPQIIRAKLKCIHETIGNELLLRDFEARRELIELFSGHLKEHINRQQELKLCAQIISDILKFLHNEKINIASCSGAAISSGTITDISREIDILVNTLLEPIVRVIVELSTTTSGSVNLISINLLHSYVSSFMTLLRLMDEAHYRRLLEKKNRKEKKELLLQVFYVFKQIFQPEMYNNDWTVMKMVANHIILCSLQEFSLALTEDFLGCEKGGSFDVQLWNSFFNLSVSFLTQSSLQLENFSPSKRETILNKYQDMRVLMGFLILSMWERLGNQKAHFIPSMVAPFLEVTLVPEKELRKATLPIFYDMIDAEYMSNGSFKQVESKLIDKLDILVSDYKGDDGFKQLFNTILLEKVNEQNPVWKEQGIQMIHSITKLLELLLDYRSVMNGEENRDKRMSCTVNLLNFYKNEINRKEMYVRYIYKLCDLHIPAENYTEAAFTLKLHADLLNWSWNVMPRDALYSVEPLEWQRKESLYLAIIDYFDRGKCWEEGIPLIKELAEFYEKKLFDYQKLSNLLKQEARFFDNILTQLRPEPEYFRVGFYGKGFPIFLRNKVFIYRGLEYEKIGAFTARLQTEFPQSQLLTKNSSPDESIMESNEQFIQICNVKPVPESREEFEGKELPEKILSYYLVNDVKTFTFDRPIHKGPIDKDNEFKSLWIERTVLRIDCKLPGILRWFEIKSKPLVTELSPVQHARETIENMNKELQKLIASYTCEPTKALSPLTMRLQGVIEAAVNGGIGKYHDAFFDPDYISAHQAHLKDIKRLKQAILQQVRILEGGLSLHGRLVPTNVKPLHKRLVERFTLMRQSILERGSFDLDYQGIDELGRKSASIINTPLPPIPIENKPLQYGGITSSQPTHCTINFYKTPTASTATATTISSSTTEDDSIYCVPHDYYGHTPSVIPTSVNIRTGPRSQPPPPPPVSHSRPRSAGFPSNGLPTEPPSTTSTPPPPSLPPSSSALPFSTATATIRQVPISLPVNSCQSSSSSVQRSRSIPRTHHLYSTTAATQSPGIVGPQSTSNHHLVSSQSPHSPLGPFTRPTSSDDSEVPPLPPRNSNTLDKNRAVTIIPVDCRRGPVNIL